MSEKIKINLKTAIFIIGIIIILVVGILISGVNLIKTKQSTETELSEEIVEEQEDEVLEDKDDEEILEEDIEDYELSEQETEDIGNYIYDEEIQSIALEYYEKYNIETGDTLVRLNEDVSFISINLENSDLEEMSNLIKTLISVLPPERPDFLNGKDFYVYDFYKIRINDSYTITVGDEYGLTEDDKYFKVPEEMINLITKIVKQ